jgi:hypothetical protein
MPERPSDVKRGKLVSESDGRPYTRDMIVCTPELWPSVRDGLDGGERWSTVTYPPCDLLPDGLIVACGPPYGPAFEHVRAVLNQARARRGVTSHVSANVRDLA